MTSITRVIIFALIALASEPARAACTVPNPTALIGRDFAGCCTVVTEELGRAASGLRWVAVNWEGPPGGKLYIVNCRGTKIAEVNSLGYVRRIERAPRIGGSPTIAVTYVPTTGTNIQTRSTAILQYRSGRIRTLWNHQTLDAAYAPVNEQRRTSWRFRRGYSHIEAVTVDKVATRKAQKRLVEQYCFRKSDRRYVACD